MFRRKEQEPEPVLPIGKPEDSGWVQLDYENPGAYLLSGRILGARCSMCRGPVEPDWSLNVYGQVIVPHPLLCGKCEAKA